MSYEKTSKKLSETLYSSVFSTVPQADRDLERADLLVGERELIYRPPSYTYRQNYAEIEALLDDLSGAVLPRERDSLQAARAMESTSLLDLDGACYVLPRLSAETPQEIIHTQETILDARSGRRLVQATREIEEIQSALDAASALVSEFVYRPGLLSWEWWRSVFGARIAHVKRRALERDIDALKRRLTHYQKRSTQGTRLLHLTRAEDFIALLDKVQRIEALLGQVEKEFTSLAQLKTTAVELHDIQKKFQSLQQQVETASWEIRTTLLERLHKSVCHKESMSSITAQFQKIAEEYTQKGRVRDDFLRPMRVAEEKILEMQGASQIAPRQPLQATFTPTSLARILSWVMADGDAPCRFFASIDGLSGDIAVDRARSDYEIQAETGTSDNAGPLQTLKLHIPEACQPYVQQCKRGWLHVGYRSWNQHFWANTFLPSILAWSQAKINAAGDFDRLSLEEKLSHPKWQYTLECYDLIVAEEARVHALTHSWWRTFPVIKQLYSLWSRNTWRGIEAYENWLEVQRQRHLGRITAMIEAFTWDNTHALTRPQAQQLLQQVQQHASGKVSDLQQSLALHRKVHAWLEGSERNTLALKRMVLHFGDLGDDGCQDERAAGMLLYHVAEHGYWPSELENEDFCEKLKAVFGEDIVEKASALCVQRHEVLGARLAHYTENNEAISEEDRALFQSLLRSHDGRQAIIQALSDWTLEQVATVCSLSEDKTVLTAAALRAWALEGTTNTPRSDAYDVIAERCQRYGIDETRLCSAIEDSYTQTWGDKRCLPERIRDFCDFGTQVRHTLKRLSLLHWMRYELAGDADAKNPCFTDNYYEVMHDGQSEQIYDGELESYLTLWEANVAKHAERILSQGTVKVIYQCASPELQDRYFLLGIEALLHTTDDRAPTHWRMALETFRFWQTHEAPYTLPCQNEAGQAAIAAFCQRYQRKLIDGQEFSKSDRILFSDIIALCMQSSEGTKANSFMVFLACRVWFYEQCDKSTWVAPIGVPDLIRCLQNDTLNDEDIAVLVKGLKNLQQRLVAAAKNTKNKNMEALLPRNDDFYTVLDAALDNERVGAALTAAEVNIQNLKAIADFRSLLDNVRALIRGEEVPFEAQEFTNLEASCLQVEYPRVIWRTLREEISELVGGVCTGKLRRGRGNMAAFVQRLQSLRDALPEAEESEDKNLRKFLSDFMTKSSEFSEHFDGFMSGVIHDYTRIKINSDFAMDCRLYLNAATREWIVELIESRALKDATMASNDPLQAALAAFIQILQFEPSPAEPYPSETVLAQVDTFNEVNWTQWHSVPNSREASPDRFALARHADTRLLDQFRNQTPPPNRDKKQARVGERIKFLHELQDKEREYFDAAVSLSDKQSESMGHGELMGVVNCLKLLPEYEEVCERYFVEMIHLLGMPDTRGITPNGRLCFLDQLLKQFPMQYEKVEAFGRIVERRDDDAARRYIAEVEGAYHRRARLPDIIQLFEGDVRGDFRKAFEKQLPEIVAPLVEGWAPENAEDIKKLVCYEVMNLVLPEMRKARWHNVFYFFRRKKQKAGCSHIKEYFERHGARPKIQLVTQCLLGLRSDGYLPREERNKALFYPAHSSVVSRTKAEPLTNSIAAYCLADEIFAKRASDASETVSTETETHTPEKQHRDMAMLEAQLIQQGCLEPFVTLMQDFFAKRGFRFQHFPQHVLAMPLVSQAVDAQVAAWTQSDKLYAFPHQDRVQAILGGVRGEFVQSMPTSMEKYIKVLYEQVMRFDEAQYNGIAQSGWGVLIFTRDSSSIDVVTARDNFSLQICWRSSTGIPYVDERFAPLDCLKARFYTLALVKLTKLLQYLAETVEADDQARACTLTLYDLVALEKQYVAQCSKHMDEAAIDIHVFQVARGVLTAWQSLDTQYRPDAPAGDAAQEMLPFRTVQDAMSAQQMPVPLPDRVTLGTQFRALFSRTGASIGSAFSFEDMQLASGGASNTGCSPE